MKAVAVALGALALGLPAIALADPPPPYPVYYPPPPPPPVMPAPGEPTEPEPAGYHRGFTFQISGGGVYRRLYDISIMGGELHTALGGTRKSASYYGTLDGMLARTTEGLRVYSVHPGCLFEKWMGGVRIGFGARFTVLFIDRVTRSSPMVGFGGGLNLGLTYDVYASEGSAMFIGARFNADLLPSGDDSLPVLWGPTLSLGYRL